MLKQIQDYGIRFLYILIEVFYFRNILISLSFQFAYGW